MREKAEEFGKSLDNDNFNKTKTLLSDHCVYNIGQLKLIGPESIINLYQQNMINGRKKLDKLEWGKSMVEDIKDNEFYIHFTDHLTHQSVQYTHKCKQRIRFGEDGKIIQIDHIDNPDETNKLNEYYQKVGLK